MIVLDTGPATARSAEQCTAVLDSLGKKINCTADWLGKAGNCTVTALLPKRQN